MDKKLAMKISDSWKDFRLNSLTEAMKIFPAGAQHGFDLTDFKPRGFEKFLTALGIPKVAKGSSTGVSWSAGNNFYWRNKDIIIITANNPITGQYYAPDRRSPEKNYASYVGIETKNPNDMEKVVKLFKQHTSYRKGESKGRRDFV